MGERRIQVTLALLLDLFAEGGTRGFVVPRGLPRDVQFVGRASVDPLGTITMTVESPDWEPVPLGAPIPMLELNAQTFHVAPSMFFHEIARSLRATHPERAEILLDELSRIMTTAELPTSEKLMNESVHLHAAGRHTTIANPQPLPRRLCNSKLRVCLEHGTLASKLHCEAYEPEGSLECDSQSSRDVWLDRQLARQIQDLDTEMLRDQLKDAASRRKL